MLTLRAGPCETQGVDFKGALPLRESPATLHSLAVSNREKRGLTAGEEEDCFVRQGAEHGWQESAGGGRGGRTHRETSTRAPGCMLDACARSGKGSGGTSVRGRTAGIKIPERERPCVGGRQASRSQRARVGGRQASRSHNVRAWEDGWHQDPRESREGKRREKGT